MTCNNFWSWIRWIRITRKQNPNEEKNSNPIPETVKASINLHNPLSTTLEYNVTVLQLISSYSNFSLCLMTCTRIVEVRFNRCLPHLKYRFIVIIRLHVSLLYVSVFQLCSCIWHRTWLINAECWSTVRKKVEPSNYDVLGVSGVSGISGLSGYVWYVWYIWYAMCLRCLWIHLRHLIHIWYTWYSWNIWDAWYTIFISETSETKCTSLDMYALLGVWVAVSWNFGLLNNFKSSFGIRHQNISSLMPPGGPVRDITPLFNKAFLLSGKGTGQT